MLCHTIDPEEMKVLAPSPDIIYSKDFGLKYSRFGWMMGDRASYQNFEPSPHWCSSLEPEYPHLKGDIWVDLVLKYDVWTLNINSSTFSMRRIEICRCKRHIIN